MAIIAADHNGMHHGKATIPTAINFDLFYLMVLILYKQKSGVFTCCIFTM